MSDVEWFLPIGEIPAYAFLPTQIVCRRTDGVHSDVFLPILGPPIHRDAIAAPMSAEARAVLAGAKRYADTGNLTHLLPVIADYARSLTPPDPLAEARNIVAELRRSVETGHEGNALDRLEAALAKLGDKP